jgi:hypothetical protein
MISHDTHLQIGSLLFEGIDQIDLTGPFEVLSRIPNATYRIYGKTAQPVRDVKRLLLRPRCYAPISRLFVSCSLLIDSLNLFTLGRRDVGFRAGTLVSWESVSQGIVRLPDATFHPVLMRQCEVNRRGQVRA